jgi:transposase
VESEAQYRTLLIEKLKFTIRKLRRERFGQSAERGALLDQLELQLADLEADAAQSEAAARIAATGDKIMVASFERRRPATPATSRASTARADCLSRVANGK